jgi:TFIIF-interacting CTD phosphatase-like protein
MKPKSREMELKKTLVLDLDETLVHANFKNILGADISKF